ncbi:MAG: YvrJ family protein [Maledivibacter sp.]|jgi:hypothetical protein|nr:YvrJ family protein [Maledivibacter sp.]
MDMDLVQLIGQVGFPIAVATFSLLRLEKTMKENTRVMIRICERLEIKEVE